MVQRRLSILEDLKEERTKLKNHREEILEENKEYSELEEQKKLVKEQAREKKKSILEIPEYKVVEEKLKEVRAEIRDHRDALSQELLELYEEEGTTEIEGPEGKVKKLKFKVRLVNA